MQYLKEKMKLDICCEYIVYFNNRPFQTFSDNICILDVYHQFNAIKVIEIDKINYIIQRIREAGNLELLLYLFT